MKHSEPNRQVMQGKPRDISARPKPVRDELGNAQSESGLSMDADELGVRFLEDATESARGRHAEDMSIAGEAPSDAALSGPNFVAEQTVWDSTVAMSLQDEDITLVDEDDVDEEDERPSSADTLDLTRDAIREASLLDYEGRESGEIESPILVTDDNLHEPAQDSEKAVKPARKKGR